MQPFETLNIYLLIFFFFALCVKAISDGQKKRKEERKRENLKGRKGRVLNKVSNRIMKTHLNLSTKKHQVGSHGSQVPVGSSITLGLIWGSGGSPVVCLQ